MHASPAPAPTPERDARSRGLRTLAQTVIGSGLAGLLLVVATVLTDLLSTGEAVTIAAAVQALVPPVAAYVWRRLEGNSQ